MSIDTEHEKLIRINEVPALDWLPTRKGRRLSTRTVRRWTIGGVRGVKLEAVVVGGAKCTSELALMRFFERLAAPVGGRAVITPSQHRRAQARAKAILDAAGI